jgi:2-oxoglutarate dehydrogenase E2 component (dihydrolipoamide succinyltransferase)
LGTIAEGAAGAASAPAPKAAAPAPAPAKPAEQTLSPAVRKAVVENNINPADVPGTGKDARITKGDVIQHLASPSPLPDLRAAAVVAPSTPAPQGTEERVKMTRLRATIARRLKDAQNTAAMLTTFNEVDMTAVMALRNQYKDTFEKKHGTKLGFMSFFVKAVIQALKDVPAVNAEIDGEDVVYKNYYHVGVAVGTDKGLVVPVVRNADMLSFAGIEQTIAGYGKKARDGQLTIADMQGGTFTISNGGIYGSLMSTPILNAPQSGILGMHKIQDRPIALGGQVVIRPMMYLALSYDHRIVDGKEAVTFLVRIKEGLEDPQRALLDL